MSLLRRIARLNGSDRRLLAEAGFVVPIVRIALTLLPFRLVHRGIAAATRRLHRSAAPQHSCTAVQRHRSNPSAPVEECSCVAVQFSPDRITWAVTAVAARVPRASCLTQALAATLMLVRHGHAATLRVGVAKNDDGTLRAHAWLESGGQAILGEPAPGAFTPFPPVALS